MLPGRSQGTGQGITRSRGPVEVGRAETNVFWLQKDAVERTLDVERASVGAVGPVIWNHCIGRRTIGGRIACRVHRQTRLHEGCLQLGKFVIVGRRGGI